MVCASQTLNDYDTDTCGGALSPEAKSCIIDSLWENLTVNNCLCGLCV